MSTRRITVTLTEAEAEALDYAVGNSMNDGNDRDVFVHPASRSAAWRGRTKLRNALQSKSGPEERYKQPSASVIDGIIKATIFVLAGEQDENDPDSDEAWRKIRLADAWARGQRSRS